MPYTGDEKRQKQKEAVDRYQNKRRAFIKEYKTGKPCADCGEHYPSYVMDFHHLRDKKFQVNSACFRNFETIIEEIEKCILLCANCHRKRTYGGNHES